MPGRSGTGDIYNEVEPDVPVPRRRAAVIPRLKPLGGDRGKAMALDVPVLERSRELLD